MPPFKDERRGLEFSGAFNNHNVEKLGITIDLRLERGKELLRKLIAVSDVVTENFAAGVFARLGFSYDELRAIRNDVIYVSNCGFGQHGPYRDFKSWGPIVQAVCGLSFGAGLPDHPPAGIGYSYMDHHGANFMAIAVLSAVVHRARTGEGQWVDMACTEAGASLSGPAMLDYTVNARPLRRPGKPDSNHSECHDMVPHNIYAAKGVDEWVAIACRHDGDWRAFSEEIDEEWARYARLSTLAGRADAEAELDGLISSWTRARSRTGIVDRLRARGIPAAIVASPEDRIENDKHTIDWGLWPIVEHTLIGDSRVEGLPIHLSETDWSLKRGAPCLGEHNDIVLQDVLGLSTDEIASLRDEGVL
jgi:crotonobetainyl-CoA:carnitine CoA-transferase CaiB-like acyl-CoA transferase